MEIVLFLLFPFSLFCFIIPALSVVVIGSDYCFVSSNSTLVNYYPDAICDQSPSSFLFSFKGIFVLSGFSNELFFENIDAYVYFGDMDSCDARSITFIKNIEFQGALYTFSSFLNEYSIRLSGEIYNNEITFQFVRYHLPSVIQNLTPNRMFVVFGVVDECNNIWDNWHVNVIGLFTFEISIDYTIVDYLCSSSDNITFTSSNSIVSPAEGPSIVNSFCINTYYRFFQLGNVSDFKTHCVCENNTSLTDEKCISNLYYTLKGTDPFKFFLKSCNHIVKSYRSISKNVTHTVHLFLNRFLLLTDISYYTALSCYTSPTFSSSSFNLYRFRNGNLSISLTNETDPIYLIHTSCETGLFTYDNTHKILFSSNLYGFTNSNNYISLSSNGNCFSAYISSSVFYCLHCRNDFKNENGQCKCQYSLENSYCYLDHCIEYLSGDCISCEDSYFLSDNTCNKCSDNCSKCINSTACIHCNDGFYSDDGACVDTKNCYISNNNGCVVPCFPGYYFSDKKCKKCKDYCLLCTSKGCVFCDINFQLFNGECIDSSNENYNQFVVCEKNQFIENGTCTLCSLRFQNCLECDYERCILCDSNSFYFNGSCIQDEHCNEYENGKCISCISGYFIQDGKCSDQYQIHCLYATNGKCQKCVPNYYLSTNNICSPLTYEMKKHCVVFDSNGCLRCEKPYFSKDGICTECQGNCKYCDNSDYCLTCRDGSYMDYETHQCLSTQFLNWTCQVPKSDGSGCLLCKNRFYRELTRCHRCMFGCKECNTNSSCLACENDCYMTTSGSCSLLSKIVGCIESDPILGCTTCSKGYYKNNKECSFCKSNCSRCTSSDNCHECSGNEFILNRSDCIYASSVEKCIKVERNKCSACSFMYKPSEDGVLCVYRDELIGIFSVSLFLLIVFILILLISIFLIHHIVNRYSKSKQKKEQHVRPISKFLCKFFPIQNGICCNKSVLDLYDPRNVVIPVCETTKETFVIGNRSRNTIQVKLVYVSQEKYQYTIEPTEVLIPRNHACLFTIEVFPFCTCKVNDMLPALVTHLKSGKTEEINLLLTFSSQLSSRLDFDDIIEESEIGEGTFGVVFKGKYRGFNVAIKKLKFVAKDETNECYGELTREIKMLEKFRNDYIVHFYGAVMTKSLLCLVTEFAPFGSMQSVIHVKKYPKPITKIRYKLCLDMSKGIHYLHSNGILHRDIKPDNVLVFSLEKDIPVNVKLTDFGSSRNVNMLISNMTFTQGIGTPAYMAPEVLTHKKYRMPADIFSLSITLFEVMGWDVPYDYSQFSRAWKIAEFVTTGKRLKKPNKMDDNFYDLLCKLWCDNPDERLTIDELVEELLRMAALSRADT